MYVKGVAILFSNIMLKWRGLLKMRTDGIDLNSSDGLLEILPLLPNRVWRTYTGGLHLDQMSGNPAPADGHFPEDWIISTTSARNIGREEHASEGLSRTIIDGMEYYLKDLFESHYQELAGIDHYQARGDSAGFLMKYLDSSVRLHLQCHPTISFAKQRLNANSGKTEGYMILGVRPDIKPYIYLGFQRPPEPGSLRRAIIAQDTDFILSCFDRIPVRVGDVFLVPGGLPHAIG